MKLNYDCTDLLTTSDLPWVKYRIHKALCGDDNREELSKLKKQLTADHRISGIVAACKQWPEMPLKGHNDAKHCIHKMGLLVEFGLDRTDPAILEIVDRILHNQADNGAFLSNLQIAEAYGGTGEASLNWLLCDFPILLRFLIATGLGDNPQVRKGIEALKETASDNGWRCLGSVSKFRGPGRKTDHCPYATLVSLEAFSTLNEFHNEDFIKAAINAIFNHWAIRNDRKIYMFGMGTDFKKLKYPSIWYDIVHVCRVLSHYDYAKGSEVFEQLLGIIIEKQLPGGGFVPESIYNEYKGWDFGQKKEASPSLTLAIWELFNNIAY